ncbi:MAG: hypothetical protein FJX23_00220 [Alphaproteobacteria bacterium]|nr:hypothetical protein [Alphaproteobacteria bacterium]
MGNHYPLLDQRLDEIRKAESDDLQLNFDRMNGEDIERVAQAIFTAPFLRKVHFMGPVNSAATHLLSEALASRSDIVDFGWTSNKGQDENIAKAINSLENSKGLNTLYVTWSDAGEKTMDAVIKRIEANPDFEHLFASGGTWSQETHDRLAEAVKDKKSLITLNTSTRKLDLDDTKLAEALANNPHPNLLAPIGCHELDVIHLKNDNNAACERVKTAFKRIPEEIDQNTFNATLTPQLLADSAERLPALKSCDAMGATHLAHYTALAETLPQSENPLDISTLFAKNETGFAPIENPLTWREVPDLLAQLESSGKLDNESLSLRTEKGSSLSDMALLHAPAGEVLPVLNRFGIKLKKDALLTEEGQPTELLERLHSRGELSAIFSPTNWTGSTPGELRATVEALPKEMADKLPPLNGLQQILRAAQPSRSGIGR